MKVVHVIPHINDEASGPSYAVPRLCQSLAVCGDKVELMCLAANSDINGLTLSLHPQWPAFRRFAISTSLARSLRERSDHVEIVHNHSLWSMSNVAAGLMVPGRRARLVSSPHGTLSTWALRRARLLKQCLWPLQRQVLERADLLHATCAAEHDQIRMLGLGAPVAVIPIGVDVPPVLLRKPAKDTRTLLFLSRIHEVKGIERLLQAWRRLESDHADWRLVIAGKGEKAYVRAVVQLAKSLGLRRVHFAGPLYGADKARAYAGADLFVLPSHSENFAMVVAEALSYGCPAVVSRGAPWSGLESERCGWWVGHGTDELCGTLDTAFRLAPNELVQMGARGRAWMKREFDWDSIGPRMAAAYRWTLDGGPLPESIRIAQ